MKRLFTFLMIVMLCNKGAAQAPPWLWAIGGSGGGNFQSALGLYTANTSNDLYMGGRIAGTVTLGGVTGVGSGAATTFTSRLNTNGVFSFISPMVYSGGFDYEEGYSVDQADNSYNTGIINSGSGVFMNRYNSTGTQTWSVTYPGNGSGFGLVADAQGNMYAIGLVNSAVTFGSVTLPGGGSYLVKFNNTGTPIWAHHLDAEARAILVDNKGNLFVSGGYSGTPTFGTITAPAATGYAKFFIAKYDTAGAAKWVTTASSAGFPAGVGMDGRSFMTMDMNGDIFVTAYFQATAQFGSISVTSAGGKDIFVAKCLARGSWEWVKTAGGTGDDYPGDMKLDKDYDVYVTGAYIGPAQFGSQAVTGLGAQDIFVTKYANSTGDQQWVQTAGSTNGEGGSAIAIDKNKFVYIASAYSFSCTFGATTLSSGIQGCIFVAKLDTLHDRKIIPDLAPSYCVGSPHALPYKLIGTFNAGNTFTAQLSDVNGSFINAVNLGSVTSNTDGTINITIPPGTTLASTYILRVISSNPAYSSFDYGFRVAVTGPCTPTILNGDSTTLDTVYCFENINHEIMGVPHGGVFTGCGIVDSGGKWFFNPALAANNATNYPFKCSITYRLPGGEDSTQMMTVNQPESVNAGNDYITCTGKFQLNAITSGGPTYTYAWVPVTGLTNPNMAATAGTISGDSQQYRVQIINTATGCKASDSVVIYHDFFTANLLKSADTICELNSIAARVQIVPERIVLYQWDMGDGTTATTPTVQHIYDRVGSYTITLITQDAYCADTTNQTVYATDFHVRLTANDTIVERGATVTLLTNADEPYHVTQWRPTEMFNDQGAAAQTFVPKISGQEYVIVAESDRFGCEDSARIAIRLNSDIFIPDAFTPNGDGRNDYFRPVGSGEPFTVSSFKIFDRWGKVIFAAEGAAALKGWDGTANGQPEEIGTYYYNIEMTKYNGEPVSTKGDITLIR